MTEIDSEDLADAINELYEAEEFARGHAEPRVAGHVKRARQTLEEHIDDL
jgi:hypothetical protein